jgi:protein-arginine kinase activator protein McsA
MRCSICNAKKTPIRVTQKADGKSVTVHLCQRCARETGVGDPAGFSLADLLSSVKAAQTGKRILKY